MMTNDEKLIAAREAAGMFAQAHIKECAAELLAMRETGVLPEGRVRELARLCAVYSGAGASLLVAEGMIHKVALQIAAVHG